MKSAFGLGQPSHMAQTVSSTLFSSPFNIESSPGLMKVDTVSFSKYLNGYLSE